MLIASQRYKTKEILRKNKVFAKLPQISLPQPPKGLILLSISVLNPLIQQG